MAISHANTVLDWMGNLPEDEMPPEWMWPFGEDVEEHFEMIRIERKKKYSGGKN